MPMRGSEVVKELKKRDADVRVLVRKPDVKSPKGQCPRDGSTRETRKTAIRYRNQQGTIATCPEKCPHHGVAVSGRQWTLIDFCRLTPPISALA
jgi:hypothetical protein